MLNCHEEERFLLRRLRKAGNTNADKKQTVFSVLELF